MTAPRLPSALPAALFVACLASSALFASDLGVGGAESWRRGLLAALLAGGLLATRRRAPRTSGLASGLTLVLVALAATSLTRVTDLGLAIGRLGDLLLLAGSLLLARRLTPGERRQLVLWGALGTSLLSLVTLVAAPWPQIDAGGGLLLTRNLSTTLAALSLPFAAGLALCRRCPRGERTLAAAAALSSLGYLALAGNRLAVIAAGLGLLLALTVLRPPVRRLRLPAGLAALTAAVLFVLWVAPDRDSGTVTERLHLWSASLTEWQSAPLLGVGIGQWPVHYPEAVRGSEQLASGRIHLRGGRQPGHAHNDLAELTAELGPLGLLLLLALVGAGLATGLRRGAAAGDAAASGSLLALLVLALGAFPLAQPEALVLLGLLVPAAPEGERPRPARGRPALALSVLLVALLGFSLADVGARLELRRARAWVHATPSDFAAASGAIERARQLAPWSFQAERLATWTLAVQRRPEAALAAAESALARRPGHPGALNDLALCLRAVGRDAEAEPLLRLALETMPSDPEVALNLANLAADRGSRDEAARLFERALSRNANLTSAWSGLADLAQAAGDLRGAVTYHEAARTAALRNRLFLGELPGSPRPDLP